MRYLKQSTAVTIKVGPFLDDTDGKTPETALTITQADVRLSKNGGNFAQKNSATSATHDENGWYDVALSTTDTNTLGSLVLAINEAGALPVWVEFQVAPANVYDSLFSTDNLQVDLVQWRGTQPNTLNSANVECHVNTINTSAITAAAIATNAIDADSLATDAITEIASAVLASGNSAGWADGATATEVWAAGTRTLTGAVTVGTINSNVITAASIASSAITNAKFATGAIDANALASSAASEIASAVVTSGNAEGWSATGLSIDTIVASGNAEGWNLYSDATLANQTEILNRVTNISGLVTSLNDPTVGQIISGVFDEVIAGTKDFRTAAIEIWAYTSNKVDLSSTVSGVLHTYYDPSDVGIFTLEAQPSGRIRTDI